MAVFIGGIQIDGTPLTDILNGETVNGVGMNADEWVDVQEHVRGGGARIIDLRGRSSFQSPAQQSVFMLRGVLGESYDWPCGAYLNAEGFDNIMMAMPVALSASGVSWSMPEGTEDDINALRESYAHLTALRDQTIDDGILPPLSEWGGSNVHLG